MKPLAYLIFFFVAVAANSKLLAQDLKYSPNKSKKYTKVVVCEYNPDTPDTYKVVQASLKIYATGNLTAFVGFVQNNRKWCQPINLREKYDQLGDAVLEFEQEGKHFLAMSTMKGFESFWVGNGVTSLPTWLIYGIVSD